MTTERTDTGRLTIAVFMTVLALIVIVLAVQRIPHAQRPTIRQPTATTITITTTPRPNGP
ncbi:MAG TPA: hypothetical protein VIM17_09620 [Jatrophihabitantaceae bacterium]